MKSELKVRTLQNLADAYSSQELRVNREYQRGVKWTLPQKQGLIDSLLRGYQIPIFYIHLESKKNNYTQGIETTAWVVDGQQRLSAILGYRQNEFALPDPRKSTPGTAVPVDPAEIPAWAGKRFEDLSLDDRERLLNRELLVVEMTASQNAVRDLFIRLQAGTPLTAQEKRDAWPGDFTNFVIRHAGKPGHPLSKPSDFFTLFPASRSRRLTVDDGDHYVDGRAEIRKFFAGLAMTIMLRERVEVDFVDLKGKTINEFYKENLDLGDDDAGRLRVVRMLDLAAQLPGFNRLRDGSPMSFLIAFHFAMLVDSLDQGRYATTWRDRVVPAFVQFKEDVASDRLHYRETHQARPHFERFGRLLSGSGSDTAEVIRRRHSFMLAQVYPRLNLTPLDRNRRFDPLEREVVWNRDHGQCRNPDCKREAHLVPFREAHVHHVVEHAEGGPTTLENGILVCEDCHMDPVLMQRLAPHFQEYLRRIYAATRDPMENDVNFAAVDAAMEAERDAADDADGNGRRTTDERLQIVVDWGALDIDRGVQTFRKESDVETIVELLSALLATFGASMREQLTEYPIIRFPLSEDPNDFMNRAKGVPYGSTIVPPTKLRFCAHSQRTEKRNRLRELFSRLTLPDGSDFPPGSVEISIGGEEANRATD